MILITIELGLYKKLVIKSIYLNLTSKIKVLFPEYLMGFLVKFIIHIVIAKKILMFEFS